MDVLDLSLDSTYVSQESPKLVIRNTFLEVQKHKGAPLRRVSSGSDLSLSSHSPSVDELKKQWSETTSQTGSSHSRESSGRSTPVRSWADITDESDDDGETFQGNDGATVNWVPPAPTEVAMKLYEKLQALANGRSLAEKDITKLQNDPTVNQHIPPDMEGNPSSLGSIPHGLAPAGGICKPCVFLHINKCSRGQYCLHCHLPHANFKPKRLRASKATRQRRAKCWEDDRSTTPSKKSSAGYASGSSIASTGSSQSRNSVPPMTQPPKSTKISL